MPYYRKRSRKMPQRKRNGRRGRTVRYTRPLREPSWGQVALKAYRATRTIWNHLNVEKKVHDVDISQSNMTTTTQLYQPLAVITQGDGTSTRDGRKLEISSIDLNLDTWVDIAAPASSTFTVRLLLVECMTSQAPSTIADVLDTAGFADPITALRKLDTVPFYNVWRDISFNITQNGSVIRKKTNLHLKNLNHKVTYTEADTTGSSIIKGALYLLAYSSATAINEVNMAGSCRVRFIDN